MKRAHAHLLSVVAAELNELIKVNPGRPLRLLDVGCGYGGLIRDLLRSKETLGWGDHCIEIYGYEVFEHRGSTPGYEGLTLQALRRVDPSIEWSDRIRIAPAAEAWPFDDDFFDGAFSNQVLEHVCNIEPFFQQLNRVTRSGGFAAHYYPSREIVVEPHSGVPLAHWQRECVVKYWLQTGSLLGFGKYRRYRKERGACLKSFSDEFQNYLKDYTYFRSNGVLLEGAKASCGTAGFKYTRQLVSRGLRNDWKTAAYHYAPVYRQRSVFSPFTCSTLLQRMV